MKSSQTTRAHDDIALKYITYLASNDEKLAAFCTSSGLGISDLKERLPDPAFQGFVLDILLQDESELLAFAADINVAPETVMLARTKLPGFAE